MEYHIYKILSELSTNQPNALSKEIVKLSKKLESVTHCPVTENEFARMKPFSANGQLSDLVIDVITDYRNSCTDRFYDSIGFWYCVALVSFAGGEQAERFLSDLTDELISQKSSDTSLMRRNIDMACDERYKDIKSKIDEYFKRLKEESPIYEFAKMIGMTLPEDVWSFSFKITNYDEFKFYNDCTPKERKSRFELSIDCYPPLGDGECFTLNFQNLDNSVHMHNVTNLSACDIKTASDIMQLKKTITAIEEYVGIKFNRTFYTSYFSRGVKGKKLLQDWLRSDI